jgi:peptidoglycan/LPS O-acetylase OafA/YrhL
MIDPEVYRGLARSHDAVRYLCCALFLQSIWNTNSVPFSNGPFWSLGYEFWYYAIFGAVVLIDSAKWRILLVLAMALFVGPAILLLMPCWLVGVVLYLGARKGLVPASWAWIGFLGSVPVFAVIFYGLPVFPGKPGWLPLLYANAFASDFVVALGLAGMIWCFDQAFFTIMLPARLVGTVRFWADHTFSLYLYHVPLIIFAGAVVPFDRSNPWQDAAMAGGVLATVLVLSLYTESKRPQWARFFDWTWDKTAAFFRARGS